MRRRLALVSLVLGFSISAFSQTDKRDKMFPGDFKRLESAVDPANSHNPEALYLLSKIQEALHKNDEAAGLAEMAVRLDPQKAKYHLQLAIALSEQIKQARLFRKIALATRIHSEFETAVKLKPEDTECLLGLMMFYQAAPGIVGGNKGKAQKIARQISRIDTSMGYLARAELARASGHKKDEIEELYWSAFREDPGNVETVFALAGYYASGAQKQYDSAESYAQQALRNLDQTISRLNYRAASR